MSNEGVCRTAPATPGLLIILNIEWMNVDKRLEVINDGRCMVMEYNILHEQHWIVELVLV